ncbi:hydroxylase [Acetobacter indonesiensis NRIC 0313]|uniref:Oxygenase 2OG-Fe(II)/hydroxylase n=1 Tax=Acetobacter indonesiensis TaxID=104101 RepID=A0A6N3T119_9PROT|nr:Fe2+-dependent dioxygenase [Acetobacter indonesiensis]GAN63507.1 oxygenase 2OG-Fe(II)/hydroxylase [Acetobacter indonesiensis]GBQ56196.1 hydroxylase [Acetobacter indonesiensis NRIC 0313]GEN02891.1 PKHD-type hydroxylase PiuC [Acetobacter indonesiensis]
MMLHIPNVLTPQELAHCRAVLAEADWQDGKATAGQQSAKAKHNLQLPLNHPQHRELAELVLRALGRNPTFNSAVMPFRVVPPLFNRYDAGMGFGAHVDNAVRPIPDSGGMRVRTDVSSTLFLSHPEEYDGGELCIYDEAGTQEIKLPAGDMIVYETTVLHSVAPVTHGSRWASFFWTQSMVRDESRRRVLYDLDRTVMDLRTRLPDDDPAILQLVNCYHNLMRQWCDL